MICANCTESTPDDANRCPYCGGDPSLDGAFRLEQVVGHGAVGTTYRATRIEDGRTVAIKELLVRKVESLKALELFQREARILEQLDHRGIPDFYGEVHVDAGRSVALYLIQEFIDGHTLLDEFERSRPTEELVFEIAAELLDTLAYLHTLRPPVVHRDIKPANVMRRTRDQSLVLIDFGSVRDAIDTAEGGSTVAGTFGYMAPEQFMGRALPATDIYGLGATIVALLSRKDPQGLLGPDRTIQWRGRLGLSPTYASILESMLESDPEQRAADAGELAAEIRRALRGEQPAMLRSSQAPDHAALVPHSADLPTIAAGPRTLPARFRKTHVQDTNFDFLFGGIFAAAGLAAGLVPAVVGYAIGNLMPALLGLVFVVVFGGIGGFTLQRGFRRTGAAQRAYKDGVPAGALVTDIGSANYEINGKSAQVVHYEYQVEGVVYSGEFHSWDHVYVVPGDTVNILYVPTAPNESVIYDPDELYRTPEPNAPRSIEDLKERLGL